MAEKLEQLKARRAQLAATLEQLPADDGDRFSIQEVITSIDKLLERSVPAPKKQAARTSRPGPAGDYLLASIPKGEAAELRISIKTWKGRRTVDLRLYFKPDGGEEFIPSRKGVSFDASKLDALVDGLMLARQHMPMDKVEP